MSTAIHMLTLKVVRTNDGGIHATFGGRGLSTDDLAVMARAIAAELVAATSSCPADVAPSADSPGTDRCRP